jgi:iron complex outermembrane receptor protein
LGAGVDRDKVPHATTVLDADDLRRTGVPSLTRALDDELPSISINDLSGNVFQPEILFRGFVASPVQGSQQGLAVYVNGARFNQPFGDTVNWDLIPSIAIDTVNVEGPNPVFGLNALGGSISVKLKNGFTFHGSDLTAYGGSFGRGAVIFEDGRQADNFATYVAADWIRDGGFRNTSASTLYQIFTDLGWRGQDAEVHAAITGASTSLGNPGATPVQLLAVDRTANSTAPNVVYNKYISINLNGNYTFNDQTSLQGVSYFSNFSQRLVNGVTEDTQPCVDANANPTGFICTGGGTPFTGPTGAPIPDFLNGGPYGGISYQNTNSSAYGVSAQVTDQRDVAGLANHLVAGFSFDAGDTAFNSSQSIGFLDQERFVVPPLYEIDLPGVIVPVQLAATNHYYGAFFSDLLNLTPDLTLSLGGRFNVANINLYDQLGTALNGKHNFDHFNPGVGLTYKLLPNTSIYASFAESNRAPTPSELSCASPATSCQLPNAFIADPNLNQVVAQSVEVGIRGKVLDFQPANLTWNMDLFRTDNIHDILFEYSPNSTSVFFQNGGLTRRQGFEANIAMQSGPLRAMIGYSFIDATFQSAVTLSSRFNPAANAMGLIYVTPGDKLPGVPANRLKALFTYDVTDRWTLGAQAALISGQYAFGDESNQNTKLGGYFVLGANTKYRITDNIQLFAYAENLLNNKYSTFGAFAPVVGVPAPEVPGGITNNRVESPAAPLRAYVGVRATF